MIKRLSALLLVLIPAYLLATVIPFVYHITVEGQSLENGTGGLCGAGSANPIYICSPSVVHAITGAGNYKLTNDSDGYGTLSPLIAAAETGVESLDTSIANQIMYMGNVVVLVNHYGQSGVDYSTIKKGGTGGATCCYAKQIDGIDAAIPLVNALGANIFRPVSHMILGESNFANNTTATTYEGYMVDHYTNLHGDRGVGPLVIGQIGAWCCWTNPQAHPTTNTGANGVPLGQVAAMRDHYADGTIFLAGPQWPYTYVDGVHLIGSQRSGFATMGYREMAAKHGQVDYTLIRLHRGWKPNTLRTVTISSSTITARYWVPTAPLVIDTTTYADRSATESGCVNVYGFSVIDAGQTCETSSTFITGITVSSSDTLTITLNQTPPGGIDLAPIWSSKTLNANPGGPGSAIWGNVRDSDTTTPWWGVGNGKTMYNWVLADRVTLPFSWEPAEPDLSGIPGANLRAVPGPTMRGVTGRGIIGR